MSMTDEQLRIAKNYVLTGGDNMDAIRKLVSNLFQSYDSYKSQVEEMQKTINHAIEESKWGDPENALEKVVSILQSLKGDKP